MGTRGIQPTLWQLEWLLEVQKLFDAGTLTINDLELAGIVLEWLVLECLVTNLHFIHTAIFCDNTSATSWAYKMKTSTSMAAGQLMRLLDLRMHTNKASMLTPLWIPGSENLMSDHILRAFKSGIFFAAKQNLIRYFNATFPLPQNHF